MPTRLEAVAIHQFDPFAPQVVRFGARENEGKHADVHILVGENGTGKTRLLSLLIAACGNPAELDDRKTGAVKVAVLAQIETDRIVWNSAGSVHSGPLDAVSNALISFPRAALLPGTAAASHASLRPFLKGTTTMAFRSVAAIRDEKLKPMGMAQFNNANDLLQFSVQPKSTVSLGQALSNMKIRAGMYLAGNPNGAPDRMVRMTVHLERAMTAITGRPFVFLVEPDGEELRLRVNWGGARMSLHHLPDGLRAIIGWLASCVAKLDYLLPNEESPLEQQIILFLDEPEANLHPAWQRQILPAIQTLLPRAQIFVATHSPFVVSSVNSGWVYILKADDKGSVKIGGPNPCGKGDSYIDAVEDVLGIKEWYDPETEQLLKEFRRLRDAATQTSSTEDIAAMQKLAVEIAKRSESLEAMMGRELAQFAAKEKRASR